MNGGHSFDNHTTMSELSADIVDYHAGHQPWFESLNREWIEESFRMEATDYAALQDPDHYFLKSGGVILMAEYAGEVVGTVALKFTSPGVYEFTKMAVATKFRGRKLGWQLARAALHRARELKAKKVILYSNTKLTPAIALYRKLGFREIPVDGPYERSDIKMELVLNDN